MRCFKLAGCVLLLLLCIKAYTQTNTYQGDDAAIKKLQKYVGNNIRYPAIAREYNIYGRVIASFDIGRDKKITGVKVTRNLNPACDKEVVRVLEGYPVIINLSPNIYTIAVNFSLEDELKKIKTADPVNAYLLKNYLFEVNIIGYPSIRKTD